VIRTPSFQKYAGRVATSYLSDILGAEVLLEKIRISESLLLEIKNLSVKDLQGETLLSAGRLDVSLAGIRPRKHEVHIRYLKLEEGSFSLITYQGDSMLNINRLLSRFSSQSKGKDTLPSKPWSFYCGNFHLDKMRFIFRDENNLSPGPGIDYADMDISRISMDAENISIIVDSVNAEILRLTAWEKSGIDLKKFSGKASFSGHMISVQDLAISMNESLLDLDLVFSYPKLSAFNEFLDSVHIKSTLRPCDLNLKDIGYFAPELLAMDDPIRVSGDAEGTVSNFTALNFTIDAGDYTHFLGDIKMKGLPDIYATDATLEIDQFTVMTADVESFALPGHTAFFIDMPDLMDKLGLVTITGRYSGLYNDFDFSSRIETALGDLDVNVSLSLDRETEKVYYSGDVLGMRLNIGALIDNPEVGTLDIDAEIVGEGLTAETMKASSNIWIDNLEFREHQYERVVIGGDFTARTFIGRCMVYDDALSLAFDGALDFTRDHPAFQFAADLDRARFYDMKISDRSRDMELSGKFKGNFTGIDPDTFLGEIDADSISYTENRRTYVMNSLVLFRDRNEMFGDILRLRSDYADVDADGKFSFKYLLPQMVDFLGAHFANYEARDSSASEHPQNIAFAVHLKKTDAITDLFLEDLDVSENSHFLGKFDSGLQQFSLSGDIGYVDYTGVKAENLKLNAEAVDQGIHAGLQCDHLWFGAATAQDTSDLGIDRLQLDASLISDSLVFSLIWDDIPKADMNTGIVEGYVILPEENRIEAAITHSSAVINGKNWKIEPGNYLVYDTAYVDFHKLVFTGASEYFEVNGRLSRLDQDTLNLQFGNWQLSNFNPFLAAADLQMAGRLYGDIGFTFHDNTPRVFSKLSIDSLELNETLLGMGKLSSSWNDNNKSLMLNLSISPIGQEDRYKVLTVNGFIYPMDTLRNFDLDIGAQNLQLAAFAPLFSDFSSELKGLASGQATMEGTFDEPAFNGKLKLQRTELKIDYVNVSYSLSNEIEITENAINFQDIVIYDEYTNEALCRGSLKHRNFNDFYLDLTIEPKNLLALNLSRYDNDLFYGTAFASGTIRIYGSFEDISIDMDVTTEKGTNVYIPINYSVDVSQSDFILFKSSSDSAARVEDDYRVVIEGFKLNMGIGVKPDADVQIFLPSNMGYIKAKGAGKLQMGVDPRGYLNLTGTYVISSGLFSFSLEQLVSKRFDIVSGSSIKWEGDMSRADVNIIANYKTKTSLSGLGITMLDPSSSDQKVNVIVRIYMTNDLFNPDLRFSVAFPNLDEQTKQTVYAVLDTSDMALMNQQAISLLVLNSFTYTGSTGSSPINTTAILTNSLSSMLSSISNDFDIGLNYIPGDDVSSDEIEVALSTQLFNDRLLIDGNFGVPTDNSSQQTSAIVGDVQVEYKLTQDGRFRVKAFNRSNDVSILENDVPYTQGIGIFYRKDFNNLKEFFTPSTSRKNKKAKKSGDGEETGKK
jgi:hypothetical protein